MTQKATASMRPAQLTPENARRNGHSFPRRAGFNEAGAINAGKRRRRLTFSASRIMLQ